MNEDGFLGRYREGKGSFGKEVFNTLKKKNTERREENGNVLGI